MNTPRSLPLRSLCLLALASLPLRSADAGGYLSDHRDWRNAPDMIRPDPATRAREVAARQEAIARDIRRLQARLDRAPDTATEARIHARLREIHEAYGWVPEIGLMFGRRDMEVILNRQTEMPEDLLRAFVQFRKDLEARGADLIVMPLAPTPFFATHLVVDGVGPETEIYPGWTRMMLQLLEADIEVIDTVDEFRAEADNDLLISWVNDFHTGSRGRQIAAQALARRLQRYDFARDLAGNAALWTERVQERTGCSYPQRITMVNGMFQTVNRDEIPDGVTSWNARHPRRAYIHAPGAPDLEAEIGARRFKVMNLEASSAVGPHLNRFDLVMVGDSQLHSSVYGTGLPGFINREVGGRFRWASQSWSGFSPPSLYLRAVPDSAPQARVVVLAFLPKSFWGDEGPMAPRPMPAYRGQTAEAATGRTFRADLEVLAVSAQRDPATLDYDEALTHAAVRIVRGPPDLQGQTVGVRHWTMVQGERLAAAAAIRPGQRLDLTLEPWSETIRKDPELGTHQVFDDTDLDLTAPMFWVTRGRLSPQVLLRETEGEGR